MRYLYSLLFYLIFPGVLLRLVWRAFKAPEYLQNWTQRFGYGPILPKNQQVIWVHAVSAGESIAAVPLIRKLQSRHADAQFVISNMTPTGAERIGALLGDSVIQCYAPYDLPGMVKRFLQRVKPVLLIIIDTELWPNMIHYSHAAGVKTMLVNGRLSANSAKGYSRIAGLTRPMLNEMTLVAPQTTQHGERFIHLGLAEEKLHVTGSIKFDLSMPNNLQTRVDFLTMKSGQRLIFVAASTHPGEDEIVLKSYRQLQQQYPQLLLVIVPRHPERFDSVAKLAVETGLKTVRHSQEINCDAATQVLVVDTMGELIYFYGLADIAFIGGSLIPVGGHNMMEAAAFNLPLLMGPYVQNVDDIAGMFIDAGAMQMVEDVDSLTRAMEKLCMDEDYRRQMGAAAGEVMERNKGSLERVVALIEESLNLDSSHGSAEGSLQTSHQSSPSN